MSMCFVRRVQACLYPDMEGAVNTKNQVAMPTIDQPDIRGLVTT